MCSMNAYDPTTEVDRMDVSITVTRQQLYADVWTQPVRTVASRFGISDVGLAKLLRRHRIPVPGRGYWQLVRAGKPPRRPPLPKTRAGEPEEITVSGAPRRSDDASRSEGEERPAATPRVTPPVVEVPAQLVDPHPLVTVALRSLNAAKSDERGVLEPRATRRLDLRVTRGTVDRALRITHALLKALESAGYRVSVSADRPSTTTTEVLDESIQFCIEESVRQVAHVPSAEEKRRAAASYWDRPPRFDYVPTNSLQLRILNAQALGTRQTWGDGKKQRLEAVLGGFIVTLPGVAAALKAERARQEERKRQWQEEERQRADREMLRYQEERKARELERQMEQWRRAQQLREYVAAMTQAGSVELSTGLGIDSLAAWIAWAEQYVERVNPLGPRADPTPQ
jgi:hypothetical protein